MTHKILYTESALKDVKKLDPIVKKRVGAKIVLYSSNPLLYSKRLTNSLTGSYRWRVGSYRIIFDIKNETIIVLRIRHRREIYKT